VTFARSPTTRISSETVAGSITRPSRARCRSSAAGGIRYLNFQGGEPLLHPAIDRLVADSYQAGFRPAVITNGWLLPQRIDSLLRGGLGMLLVSIDSHSIADHERNRGLRGVSQRIRAGVAVARQERIPTFASVTVSRLVQYELLPALLEDLGFEAAIFSYPRRKPFGSSSLVFSQESSLIDFERAELITALDAIKALKRSFRILNPSASIEDVKRHYRGEEEIFPCIGGHKYFYLDWNLDIWRCEAWSQPLGSVFDLDSIEDRRDRCTACTMACYRDNSVLMHVGVALEDAAVAVVEGRLGDAARSIFRRSVASSLGAVAGGAREVARLVGVRSRARIAREIPPHHLESEVPSHQARGSLSRREAGHLQAARGRLHARARPGNPFSRDQGRLRRTERA
jgi:MoaA/NifB/PqqE/SkfB family radical SAM enzyme